jgi:hypothetical protein
LDERFYKGENVLVWRFSHRLKGGKNKTIFKTPWHVSKDHSAKEPLAIKKVKNSEDLPIQKRNAYSKSSLVFE